MWRDSIDDLFLVRAQNNEALTNSKHSIGFATNAMDRERLGARECEHCARFETRLWSTGLS